MTKMCSSTATSPPFLRTTATTPSLLRRRFLPSQNSFLRSNNPSRLPCLSSAGTRLDLSWISLPNNPEEDADDFNGWAVVHSSPPTTKKTKVWPKILIGGTCLATLLGAIAYFSLTQKGFRLQFRGLITPTESNKSDVGLGVSNEIVGEEHVPSETLSSASTEMVERPKLVVPVDSTQLEALSVLKKLKIIEDDVRGDELCIRREYARWLVRLNSLLERNPKHRIVPPVSLSGSLTAAFDDVVVKDPDFEFIQSLAEAGIIHSKLSAKGSSSDSSNDDGSSYFYPDRFISRKDLIDWKAQLEYGFLPGLREQMSTPKVDYMDVREIISSDASPEFLTDMLAGDKSIIRKVFGQSRRLQPNKPLSIAQAAVALISGRMTEAVYNEILRLEAENTSRLATMKEIWSELLERGDIEKFWDKKIKEERNCRLDVEKLYIGTLDDLEREKIIEVKTHLEHLKEKAAMDCQKQLLSSLKEEVDEMSERLATERVTDVAEQCSLQQLLGELQNEQEGTKDAKSVLEAEIEAIRILRSWIEDEARKSQARAKVLEEVARRWNWDSQGTS